jgi:hypothetical protein
MFKLLAATLTRPRLMLSALFGLGLFFSCLESCLDDGDDDDDEEEIDGDPCEGAVGCEKIPD